MIAGAWLDGAAQTLREAGVEAPRRDALLLLARASGVGKAHLLSHPELDIPSELASGAGRLLERRARREPLQYILGVQEFWGLRVLVGPGCLIPRPETEHLVETALRLLEGCHRPAVAEVGAGSGCVLMALAKERPDCRLVGLEREGAALAWARLNLPERGVLLVRADMGGRTPLRGLDLVVSNPPYITDAEWEALEPEVRDYEPESSLRCGGDPLGPYRALASLAASALKPGGCLACELGVAQARRAASLRHLHPALPWREGVRDLAGRLRVAVWEKA
jgi:release factor glutamine methyltransferase